MKRWLVSLAVLFSVLTFSLAGTHAGVITYSFESIVITGARTFQVEIPIAPAAGSPLEGLSAGETLTLYMGDITLTNEGGAVSSPSMVLVATRSDGTDAFRYVINSYGNSSGSETWSFSRHIQIDPEVGIVKNFDLGKLEMTVMHDAGSGTWSFVDETGTKIPALDGTFQEETGLSIVISAFGGIGA
jgi:hypothetical protein